VDDRELGSLAVINLSTQAIADICAILQYIMDSVVEVAG
jgi:hypothetical protein